jgi:lipoate-protein ligase B
MRIEDWGSIEYELASRRQLLAVESVGTGAESILVFCEHPSVVTLGRGVKPGDVFGWAGSTVETSRGGRATYHGPGQIVAYPIINLEASRDLHAYLRLLEQAIVATLREFQIVAEARTVNLGPDEPSLTGVWVGEHKIASIGIAVKKWVTYHGLALNVLDDPLAFQGINPCGFKTEIMTSMQAVLRESGRDPSVSKRDIQKVLAANLTGLFRDSHWT